MILCGLPRRDFIRSLAGRFDNRDKSKRCRHKTVTYTRSMLDIQECTGNEIQKHPETSISPRRRLYEPEARINQ
jgi:hypothetical protein